MALLLENLHLEIFIGVVTVLSLLYVYLTWNFDYWKKRGVPFVKPMILLGSTKDAVLGRVYGPIVFKKIYDAHDGLPYVGVYQFREPILMLRDPELIKDTLVSNFSSFHDRGMPVDEDGHPLTANLFNLAGSKWRAVRTMITPNFTSGKIKIMYQLMEECCEELRKVLKEPAGLGEELDVRERMAQLTTDIIGSCAFGLQMNAMTDSKSEFRNMGRRVLQPSFATIFRSLVLIYFNPLAKLLNLSYLEPEVETFFINIVKNMIKYREKNRIVRNDLIHFWMQLKNKGNIVGDEQKVGNGNGIINERTNTVAMTDNLIAAQAFFFFLAGFETSSSLMSFALYELALNPEIQNQLREEIDSTCKETDGKLNYEVIQKMSYLDKVTSETLRKYPPVGGLFRVCTKPYTIPGTNITLGTDARLFIPVIGIHNDPKIYPDPERFDPERFSEEAQASRHRFTYLPFGEGPRYCIGKRFGLMQAKLGLATLLKEYKFSPSKRTVVPVTFEPVSIITTAKEGIYLKISPRD